ncbi:phosphoglucomutase [Clostridium chromiireducens]|uniref:phosphoglucomutase n=1 Tax=Clostridium chromiireducens TaxID=225345 RepID=UPI003AF69811
MSNYPNKIDSFVSKLNKLANNVHVIEEIVNPVNGVYEAELSHDNVDIKSIHVYTATKLTGTRIETFFVSTPSLSPWKTVIKILSNIDTLYVTYETSGDTIEAEDINRVQDSIVQTQTELDRYKKNGIIDGGRF